MSNIDDSQDLTITSIINEIMQDLTESIAVEETATKHSETSDAFRAMIQQDSSSECSDSSTVTSLFSDQDDHGTGLIKNIKKKIKKLKKNSLLSPKKLIQNLKKAI